jgi:hypothetical protein
MRAATTTNEPIDELGSADLTDEDLAILSQVESSLSNGLQLKAWWEKTNGNDNYSRRFPTALTFNRPDHSFAFLDQAPVNGELMPVLGDLQDLFYDSIKAPAVATPAAVKWIRDQLREFVLHYFARISSSFLPKSFEPGAPSPPAFLNPFGLCPGKDVQKEGFGQTQLYYKLRETGRVGKFPECEQYAVVDMREIGTKYEWIVGDAKMFGFDVSVVPLGYNLPYTMVPLREGQLGVISKQLITNEDDPAPGISGRYGYGLATLKSPSDKTAFAYGPGYFDAGFMTFTWRLLDSGEIRVRLVFVANQPERLINPYLNPLELSLRVSDTLSFGLTSRLLAPVESAINGLPLPVRSALLDPVFGSIALANLTTGGLAKRQLCVSRVDVEKLFLFYHFTAIYTLIVNSLATWRQIPNWLDSEALPKWVTKEMSS